MFFPKLFFNPLRGSQIAKFSSALAKPKNSKIQAVVVRKKNIDQSPLKMKFLVSLVRGLWVPDAMAQLKFSPKHKAVDIGKMMQVPMLLLCPFTSVSKLLLIILALACCRHGPNQF
jgi:hypothetical protein